MITPWIIECRNFSTAREAIMRTGNIYQIANGYMGYRGTLDEFGPDELVGITLAGIFDQVGDAWREPVNAPNGGYTRVMLNGEPLSALSTPVESHRQSLNLRDATFERETRFSVQENLVTIRATRFLSAMRPHLGVIRYSVQCEKAAELVIETGIDANIWDLNGPHLIDLQFESKSAALLVHGRTHEAGKCVAVAEAAQIHFGEEIQRVEEKRNLRCVRLHAEAGETYSFEKFFAVATDFDKDHHPAINAALDNVQQAIGIGFDALLHEQRAAFAKKWAHCDVELEGDPQAQQALRYSIFQLLIAAPVKGSGNSIPARALSGQVYKGAVFWDTEMFMFPFFLHTMPDIAAELLRYRMHTLPGARAKAKTEGAGFKGAFYAWESQDTGEDACTYFNIGDPLTKRELRTHFRDKQVHISGDVAIAMWDYFKITGDDSLLLEGGAEVILECARFYYSYAYFKKDKNRYEILDVIGPDEYHERVNNNAFTNMVAKATFEIACELAAYLGQTHSGFLADLVRKIDIAQELPLFAEAARQLFVAEPDPETGIIEQFEGYFGLKDVPVETLKAQRIHPDEYLGAAQGLAVPTQVIKQADVVMMLNLFKDRYSAAVKKANWEYYEPRTEHGSSLSASAYAMVATEFGALDAAYAYFRMTATLDLEAKYKVYVGTVFMGGSHPAANGGAWMTVIFGFAGVRTATDRVIITPRLYKNWTRLAFPLAYKGDNFAVTITPKSIEIKAAEANRNAALFELWGLALSCAPGRKLMIERPQEHQT
ncbi:kojibiose phosphorylase [Rhizomicrobium palustre]|uniref:Kojibiose phosphorylase n=1 Tax=Rhizomicrobium palustre TaxID=189966 RepID=A0A846MZM1_9PROT|nr:glycoside hydrolase family 65 protein [Rhizomicrobium palustre]NIK88886.1 kojibiose phosphorylase [Rhizomicrobium palustre]